MTSVETRRVELRQTKANALQFPIFIGVVVVAVVVRQFFGAPPSPVVLAVCAVAVVLDLVFTRYLLRNTGILVVTPDDISFTRQRTGEGGDGPRQLIHRAAGSTLSFRVARNGPLGSKYTGYVLKLRDNATGDEVFAGAFGRGRVQQACESQGWSFS